MQNRGNFFTTSPLFWFGLLFLFTATITYIDFKNKVRSKVLDIVLFLLTGIAGCIIFFLWFLTDHQATALNFNILWAFPFNLVLVFYLISQNFHTGMDHHVSFRSFDPARIYSDHLATGNTNILPHPGCIVGYPCSTL